MDNINGTGVEYPTIELGGKVYTVRFTRGGILYRLNKNGINLAELGGARSFSTLIDVFHAALHGQYAGTPEDLAELVVSEEKAQAVDTAVAEALKKVFPPTQTAAVAAVEPAAPAVQ